jgi:hypothetical protein
VPSWTSEFIVGLVALVTTIPLAVLLFFRARYHGRRRKRGAAWVARLLLAATLVLHAYALRLAVDSLEWLVIEEYRAESEAVFRLLVFADENPGVARRASGTGSEEVARVERYRFLRGGFEYYLRHVFLLRPPPTDDAERARYAAALARFVGIAREAAGGRRGAPDLRALPANDERGMGVPDADVTAQRLAELLDRDLGGVARDRIEAAWREGSGDLGYDYYSLPRPRFREIRRHLRKLVPLTWSWALENRLALAVMGMYLAPLGFLGLALWRYLLILDAEAAALRVKALLTGDFSPDYLARKAATERRAILARAAAIERAARRPRYHPGVRAVACRYLLGIPDTGPLWWAGLTELPRLLEMVRRSPEGS